MKAYSAMLFIICINVAAWLLHVSGVYPAGGTLWLSPSDVVAQFGLSIFGGLAVSGAITGVISLLVRQSISASYALTIWLVGIMLSLAMWLVGGVPIVLAMMLPGELWFVSTVIQALFTVIFFVFLVEVVGQRPIT